MLNNQTFPLSLCQTAIRDMEESDKRVRLIRKSSQQLLRVINIQTEPGVEVQTEVAKVTHKHRSLSSSLKKKHSKISKDLQNYNKLMEITDELQKWIPEGREQVEAEPAVSSEPEDIKKQLEELAVRDGVFDRTRVYQ